MVLHPLQRQRPSRDKLLDAIGTRTQRLLQRRRGDVALAALAVSALPPMLRQYRELPDNLRKLAIAWRIEAELDVAITDFFSFHHMPVVSRVLWMILLERIE